MDQSGKRKRRSAALLALGTLLLTVTLTAPRREDREAAVPTLATGTQEDGAQYVVPLGRTVGIKLFSDGVLVVGLAEVPTGETVASPAREMGLREGDVITRVNDREVDTIEEMRAAIRTLGGQEMTLRVTRDERELELCGAAVPGHQGEWQLGAWIRDSMAGIGTMTFYEPETGRFAALGHGINDVDTARLMTLQSGGIMPSTVTGVRRGESGAPGELKGTFDLRRDLGILSANTSSGIFGTLADGAGFSGAAVPVARRDQVKAGPAVVLANVDGDEVRQYQAEIVRLYPATADRTRNLMLRVTDPELLEKTGGIVQGMSGSPILQEGRLVGAVTHVLVHDPTRGYGILAENMLREMES